MSAWMMGEMGSTAKAAWSDTRASSHRCWGTRMRLPYHWRQEAYSGFERDAGLEGLFGVGPVQVEVEVDVGEGAVGLGEIGIELECAVGGCARFFVGVARVTPAVVGLDVVEVGEGGVQRGVVGGDLQGLLVVVGGERERGFVALIPVVAALQIQGVGVAGARGLRGLLNVEFEDIQEGCAHGRLGAQRILHLQPVHPQHAAVTRIDQRHRQGGLGVGQRELAFEHRVDLELLCDAHRVQGAVLVGKGQGACDHAQIGDAREREDELFGESIGEIGERVVVELEG